MAALVTVMIADPAVVPGVTVTVFPSSVAVATFGSDDFTLKVPLLLLLVTVKDPAAG